MAQTTVKELVLRLVRRVDPRTSDGQEIDEANVGTVDGARFPKERILDIYKEARMVLVNALKIALPKDQMLKEVSGTMIEVQITFTLASDRHQSLIRSDYIEFLHLRGRYIDGSAVSTTLYPILLLDPTLIDVVASGTNPHYTDNGPWRYVFEVGAYLVNYGKSCGAIVASGTTKVLGGSLDTLSGTSTSYTTQLSAGCYVTIAGNERIVSQVVSNTEAKVSVPFGGAISDNLLYVADYRLIYYALDTWTLSDVTGTTYEKIDENWHPALIEIAEAISMEVGGVELGQLARKLIGGK